jgi:hypothetical protein
VKDVAFYMALRLQGNTQASDRSDNWRLGVAGDQRRGSKAAGSTNAYATQ